MPSGDSKKDFKGEFYGTWPSKGLRKVERDIVRGQKTLGRLQGTRVKKIEFGSVGLGKFLDQGIGASIPF